MRVLTIRQPVTRGFVALEFGVHQMTIHKWKSLGLPELGRATEGKGSPVMYDLIAVQKWMVEQGRTNSTVAPKSYSSKKAPDFNPDDISTKPIADLHLVLEKIRSQRATADRYELEVKVRRGDLLERSEVEEGRAERIAAVKAIMFAMPAKLAPGLVGRNQRVVQKELEGWARAVCEEFAREPGKGKKNGKS